MAVIPRFIKLSIIGFTLFGATATLPAWATPKPDQAQAEFGEKNLAVRGFDTVTLPDSVDLQTYTAVLVREPELEFDERWLRDHRHDFASRDEQKIQASYTHALRTAFIDELTDAGIQIAKEAGPTVLIVEAKLTEFRLTAPELGRVPLSRHFVDYVGSARLELMLRDGSDQRLLGTLGDHSQTRTHGALGDLKETNRAINLHDFKWLFRKWGDHFAHFIAERSR